MPNKINNQKINNLKSKEFFLLIFVMILFACFIIYKMETKFNKHIFIDKKVAIKVNVVDTWNDKSNVILNDSLVILGGNKLIDKRPNWYNSQRWKPGLKEIHPPYTLVKEKNADIFTVYKRGDTLVFKLWDPNKKDPNDPTFSDLWDYLFNNETK